MPEPDDDQEIRHRLAADVLQGMEGWHTASDRRRAKETVAIARRNRTMPQGYPVLMSKKKRVCVVTYQHSGSELFENSLRPRRNINNL